MAELAHPQPQPPRNGSNGSSGASRTGAQPSGSSTLTGQRTKASVMIVEDEAVVARDLERSIEDMGYEVTASVGTGGEALREAALRAPDLVLMDICLRGARDGVDTARLLQERYGMPIVYLTAYSDEATLARAARTLPYGYVVKPFMSADVRCAIEVALCRHAADRQLSVASRLSALGTMAAGVAHEINNPLTYMLMNLDRATEALKSWTASPGSDGALQIQASALAELQRSLDEVTEGVSRVRRIVADVSVFGRPIDGPLQLVDVRDAIAWALRVTANQTSPRARVVTDLQDVSVVRASDTRLGQVLVNLLLNAAQAIPEDDAEHQQIRVRAFTDDDSGDVVVCVEDTGCGMAPEMLGKIFDPFFTTKGPSSGTGLGLSICHGIVRALGGSLSARSTLGVGSVFEMRLPPAIARAHESAPVRSDETEATSRARILLVDDEPIVLATMKRALAIDYDVTACTSAEAALNAIRAQDDFDLILTDIRMPGMSGADLYRQCQAFDPKLVTRIAFMTGGSPADEGIDPKELSNPVLAKPFTLLELTGQVRAILMNRSAEA